MILQVQDHRGTHATGRATLWTNHVLSTIEIGRISAGVALIYAKTATNCLSDGW